jgi:hypothetical protein
MGVSCWFRIARKNGRSHVAPDMVEELYAESSTAEHAVRSESSFVNALSLSACYDSGKPTIQSK